MPVIGITGGIATGKTSFREELRARLPGALFFDADARARELTAHDEEVRQEIREQFGAGVFFPTGELNRSALRSIILGSAARKAALENILHPRIRQSWRSQSEPRRHGPEFFVADIPLLFETGGETLCDRVVVVACTAARQLERLLQRSPALDRATGEQMIAAQMPLFEKVGRADHVVWNNGGPDTLADQAALLVGAWRRGS